MTPKNIIRILFIGLIISSLASCASANSIQINGVIYISDRQDLTQVYNDIANTSVLSHDGTGNCLLNANLINNNTANHFYMNNTDQLCYNSLRINSTNSSGTPTFWYYLTNGQTEITDFKISSWNTTSNTVEGLPVSTWARSAIYASGASSKMNMTNVNASYLGYNAVNMYGVSYYNLASGNIIVNSTFLNNYYGLYLTSSNYNTITNNTLNTSNYGLFLYSNNNYNTINNLTSVSDYSNALRIVTNSNFNNITDSIFKSTSNYAIYIQSDNISIINSTGISSSSYGLFLYYSENCSIYKGLYTSYYLRNSYLNNRINSTNFSPLNTIYFYDNISIFEYDNGTGVWVKTQLYSGQKATSRNILNWTKSNLSWSETWSSIVQVQYNISGLLPNTNYQIYNGTINNFNLSTDASGILTPFTVNFSTTEKSITILQAAEENLSYPPTPVINSTIIGNFYINTTWSAGSGNITNGYNSTNGTIWINNTNSYMNTTLAPHAWQNLTIYAWNSIDNVLSIAALTNNTQITNNPPVQSSIGNKNVDKNNWLNFTISSTDADGDSLTYGTNASKGTLTTNSYSWYPTDLDVGTYYWYFNTTDNYSAVDTETVMVTVSGNSTTSSYNTTFTEDGTYYITVNGTNANGTTSTVTWIVTVDSTAPASITSASCVGNSTGFYVNCSWTNPVDANYDHLWLRYANGTSYGTNITTPTHISNITWSAHANQNLSGQTVDTSGNVNTTLVWLNATVPNNAPIQSSIGNKNVNEGQWLNFTIISSDIDGDLLTYGTNATKGTLTTNSYSWLTTYSDSGTYNWYFNTTDNYSAISTETIIVTVNNILQYPPAPIISTVDTGNFWINTTWTAGSGNITNGYNSTNGTIWINNTNSYMNTTLAPHAWQNLTIYAWNSSDNTLSLTALSNNTQIPNNVITISDVSTSYNINVGNTLTIDANYIDIDNDTGTFATNSTEGIFNTTTGILTWNTVYGDVGTYNWQINVSDGYGSVSTKEFSVTVSTTGGTGTDWDFAYGWVKYPNGTGISSTIIYTEVGNTNTNVNGYYSFGYVFEHGQDYNFNVTKSGLNWTNQTISFTSGDYEIVNATLDNLYASTFNISGYIFDDSGLYISGVTIIYSGGSNTTNSIGYYIIKNILNGTYYFTASKTGYTEDTNIIIISGANLTYQNFTLAEEITDTTDSIQTAYDAVNKSNSELLPTIMRVFSVSLLIFAFGTVFIQLRTEKPSPNIIFIGIITAVVGFGMLLLGNYLLYAIMEWSNH